MSSSPLNDIARQLATVDSLTPEAQESVRDQIQGVRRSLNDAPTELLGCLDAAATLVDSLQHLEQRAASEVQEMVVRLVDLVAASETAQAALQPEAASEPLELDLAPVEPAPRAHPLSPTPAASDPVASDPVASDPAAPDHVAPDPVSTDPVSPDPISPDPAPPTPPLLAPPPVDKVLELVEVEDLVEIDGLEDLDELDGFEDLDDLIELEDLEELDGFDELETAPLPIPVPAPMPVSMTAPTPTAGIDYSVPKLNDMMLGEVMVQLGFVKKGEVDTALRRMADYGQRFGEALIEIGAATAEDVAQGISLQRLLSQGAQNAQESKFERANVLHGILLGEILVLMGRITRDQLKQGLEHQSLIGSRIGEALVELRFINWKDLDEAIRIQHARGGSSELNDSSTMVELDGRE